MTSRWLGRSSSNFNKVAYSRIPACSPSADETSAPDRGSRCACRWLRTSLPPNVTRARRPTENPERIHAEDRKNKRPFLVKRECMAGPVVVSRENLQRICSSGGRSGRMYWSHERVLPGRWRWYRESSVLATCTAIRSSAGGGFFGLSVELRRPRSTPMGARDPIPAFLYVYVDDTDKTYERALQAGASSMEKPWDTPYGDRRGMVKDEWGNTWQIATHMGDRDAA